MWPPILGHAESAAFNQTVTERLAGWRAAATEPLTAFGKEGIAEMIVNNVRKTVIREQLTDPRFYERMSLLLDDLTKQSRDDTVAYEAFLRQAEELVRRLERREPEAGVPAALHGRHEAAVIFQNLPRILAGRDRPPVGAGVDPDEVERRTTLALAIDTAGPCRGALLYGDSLTNPQQRQAAVDHALHVDRGGRAVPQLHLYVSNEVAAELRARARERGTSVSKLLAEIVTRDMRRARARSSTPSANPSRRCRSMMPASMPTLSSAPTCGHEAPRSAPTIWRSRRSPSPKWTSAARCRPCGARSSAR